MELLGHLEGRGLEDLREGLRRVCALDAVSLKSLCGAVLSYLRKEGVLADAARHRGRHEEQLRSFVRLSCELFDAVDADSRGLIHFDDLTSYCLRAARNSLSKALPSHALAYRQEPANASPVLAAKRMHFIARTQTLYAMSSDSPLLHVFSSASRYAGTIDPLAELRKLVRLHKKEVPNVYHERRQADQTPPEARLCAADHVTVLCMEYIRSRHQVVLSSSNGYLSFWNATVSAIKGYIRARTPQTGLLYLLSADMLLTWTSMLGAYRCSVWDLSKRILKFEVTYHNCHIMAMVELPAHGTVASSDMDKNVLLWSAQQFTATSATPSASPSANRVLRLRGNTRVVRSLAYAPVNDLLLGAGIEFDAYAWDPYSGQLIMHLFGHQSCIRKIAVLSDPVERAITLDETGHVKVWSISREVGRAAEAVQSMELSMAAPYAVSDLVVCFECGKYVAVLADRVYFFNNTSTAAMSAAPVAQGVLVVHLKREVIVVHARDVTVLDLESGAVRHTLSFSDADRDCLMPADFITVAAADELGKKVYLGTNAGYVFLFDAHSFGVLRVLHAPAEMDASSETAVVGLACCRDELLTAAFANGTMKVLVGCHRVLADLPEASRGPSVLPAHIWTGGRPPSGVTMFREAKPEFKAAVLSMCLSEPLGLLALCCSDGVVRLLDALSLKLLAMFMTPLEQDNLVIPCTCVAFVGGHTPLLLGVDGSARLTIWTVPPDTPACVLVHRLAPLDHDLSLCALTAVFWQVGAHVQCILAIGDDAGGLWLVDASQVVASLSLPAPTLVRRDSYTRSMRDLSKGQVSLERMVQEPIGIRAKGRTRVLGPTKHVAAHTSSVRCIAVAETAPDAPAFLLVVSDTGIVKLFSTQGVFFGDMHSPSDPLPVDRKGPALDNSSWGYAGRSLLATGRAAVFEAWLGEVLDGTHVTGAAEEERDGGGPSRREADGPASTDGWTTALPLEHASAAAMPSSTSRVERSVAMQRRRTLAQVAKRLAFQTAWDGKVRFSSLASPAQASEPRATACMQREQRTALLRSLRYTTVSSEPSETALPSSPCPTPAQRVASSEAADIESPCTSADAAERAADMDDILRGLDALAGAGKDRPSTAPFSRTLSRAVCRSESRQYVFDADSPKKLPSKEKALDRSVVAYFEGRVGREEARAACKLPSVKPVEPRTGGSVARLGVRLDVEETEARRVRQEQLISQSKSASMRVGSGDRGRFGAYDMVDVTSFATFLLGLAPRHGLAAAAYFLEEDSEFQLDDLRRLREIASHARAMAQLDALTSKLSRPTVSKPELLRMVFEHATRAERSRISTVASAAQTAWRFMDTLRPPSPTLGKGVSVASVVKELAEEKCRIRSVVGAAGRRFALSEVHRVHGFEGWQVNRQTLLEVRNIFAVFAKTQDDGTCTLRELAMILQRYVAAVETPIRQLQRLLESFERSGLAVDGDADGRAFIAVCGVLRLVVTDE